MKINQPFFATIAIKPNIINLNLLLVIIKQQLMLIDFIVNLFYLFVLLPYHQINLILLILLNLIYFK